MTWQWWSVLPVWLVSLAAAIFIGLTVAPADRLTWIGITFGAAIILTFVIQLATGRIEGYVSRATASIGGAVVILAIATGVFALLG
jgi:hypothetical protein